MLPNFSFTSRFGTTTRSRAGAQQDPEDVADVQSMNSWNQDDQASTSNPNLTFHRSPTQDEGQRGLEEGAFGRQPAGMGGVQQGGSPGYGFVPVSQDPFLGTAGWDAQRGQDALLGGEIIAPGQPTGTGPGVAQATTTQDPQDGHGNPLGGAYQPPFGQQGQNPGGPLGHPPGTAPKRTTASRVPLGAQG